jgi:hypothetical protein
MYSVVLLTALTAGGEAGAHGGGGWWYAPLPYVDVVWPVPLHYAPSPALFGPGGTVGPSLGEAMQWIGPGGTPLSDAERQAFADYFKELSFEEQVDVGRVWYTGDLAAQRKLLEQIAAMRPKDKEKEKDKDKDKDD